MQLATNSVFAALNQPINNTTWSPYHIINILARSKEDRHIGDGDTYNATIFDTKGWDVCLCIIVSL